MSQIQTSLRGEQRERAVPCAKCRRSTWNWTGLCDDCLAPVTACLAGEHLADSREAAALCAFLGASWRGEYDEVTG